MLSYILQTAVLDYASTAKAPGSRFTDYVTEKWVEWHRRAWNHYDNDGPRTTNHVEGWHHNIYNQLRHCHPSIYTLVDKDHTEPAANEARLFQHANGAKQLLRKRVHCELEQRLIRLKHQLRTGEMDTITYVDAASYLVKPGTLYILLINLYGRLLWKYMRGGVEFFFDTEVLTLILDVKHDFSHSSTMYSNLSAGEAFKVTSVT